MRKRIQRMTAVLVLLCSALLVNVSAAAASSKPYRIEVIQNQNIAIVYTQDAKGAYTKVAKTFICTTGSATPVGTFAISDKYIWKTLMGPCYGQYSCRFYEDCLFHSVPYYKQSKDTLMYKEYNKLGKTASHGCIRLTVADAKWIYDNCPAGTVVKVYKTNKFVVQKPGHIIISSTSPNRGWDPTDPDPKNPWPKVTKPPAKEPVPEKKVPTVTPISQTIMIDKRPMNLNICYFTDKTGSTASYCSLRGFAALLDGTESQFNVTWDRTKGMTSLKSGVPYTDRNGSEGIVPFSGPQPFKLNNNTIMVNDQAVPMQSILITAPNGNAYTYVKLRDLCTALGYQVTWSAAEGIGIQTGLTEISQESGASPDEISSTDDPDNPSEAVKTGDTTDPEVPEVPEVPNP